MDLKIHVVPKFFTLGFKSDWLLLFTYLHLNELAPFELNIHDDLHYQLNTCVWLLHYYLLPMNVENGRWLQMNWLSLRNNQFKITDHFRRMYRTYLKLINKAWKHVSSWTWKREDLDQLQYVQKSPGIYIASALMKCQLKVHDDQHTCGGSLALLAVDSHFCPSFSSEHAHHVH